MPKLIPIIDGTDNQLCGYSFYCPACKTLHPFYVSHRPVIWNFNGDMEKPSFSPSLRMMGGNECHLYVSQGLIQYCNDCKHEFAGKTVPMVDWDVENWKPAEEKTMDALHTVNGQPVTIPPTAPLTGDTSAQSQAAPPAQAGPRKPACPAGRHKAECGEVGETGEHGNLGTNAS